MSEQQQQQQQQQQQAQTTYEAVANTAATAWSTMMMMMMLRQPSVAPQSAPGPLSAASAPSSASPSIAAPLPSASASASSKRGPAPTAYPDHPSAIKSEDASREDLHEDGSMNEDGMRMEILGIPEQGAKSRVETQIRICLRIVDSRVRFVSPSPFPPSSHLPPVVLL
jgi:hypothetical protein